MYVTVSPVRVNTPTKPVASPASHSLHMSTNMSQHHYQPPRPVSYTSLVSVHKDYQQNCKYSRTTNYPKYPRNWVAQ